MMEHFVDNIEMKPAADNMESIYRYIEMYAKERHFSNLLSALPKTREIFMLASREEERKHLEQHGYTASFHHSLSVCRMLIDLRVPVDEFSEDILLTSALMHALPVCLKNTDLEQYFYEKFDLETEVFDILQIVAHDEDMDREEQGAYFNRLEKNKLALLVRLADRSSVVERLYDFTVWRSNRYIYETIEYYFPMCIYAKEHYPEIIAPISILMEKIKSLMEVGEILLGRFDMQEKQLLKEIMTLREENARMRGIIRQLKEDV